MAMELLWGNLQTLRAMKTLSVPFWIVRVAGIGRQSSWPRFGQTPMEEEHGHVAHLESLAWLVDQAAPDKARSQGSAIKGSIQAPVGEPGGSYGSHQFDV